MYATHTRIIFLFLCRSYLCATYCNCLVSLSSNTLFCGSHFSSHQFKQSRPRIDISIMFAPYKQHPQKMVIKQINRNTLWQYSPMKSQPYKSTTLQNHIRYIPLVKQRKIVCYFSLLVTLNCNVTCHLKFTF